MHLVPLHITANFSVIIEFILLSSVIFWRGASSTHSKDASLHLWRDELRIIECTERFTGCHLLCIRKHVWLQIEKRWRKCLTSVFTFQHHYGQQFSAKPSVTWTVAILVPLPSVMTCPAFFSQPSCSDPRPRCRNSTDLSKSYALLSLKFCHLLIEPSVFQNNFRKR